jgi:hypothetical protein
LEDLCLAKKILHEQESTLAIAKRGRVIFISDDPGITPLVKAIENLDEELKGASLADKIVGKAGAMLCLFARVKNVWAETISESGIQVFHNAGLEVTFEFIVPKILNKKKNDLCPFERMTLHCRNPEGAYNKIKNFLDKKAVQE